MQIIKTILSDDHRIFIEGLKAVLATSEKFRFDIVGVAHDGETLINLLRRRQADLLLLDLNLAGKDGLEALSTLQKERTHVKVLVISMYDDPKIVKAALKSGAHGYILKDKGIEELFLAINTLLTGQRFLGEGVSVSDSNGYRPAPAKQHTDFHLEDRFMKKYHLTKRELEILRLITRALSNKEIAKELYISDQTVSVHRKNIMRKLGVSNTAGLIKAAYDFSLF
ncbi:MAG TPA: response regulator transcription factor [Saprospiraceae bacterium]|nr:response regulator transcription factor [Saprospiraceae bacterium]HMP13162.1 response regulator transcription factor [Saprospiraceae bacterium]